MNKHILAFPKNASYHQAKLFFTNNQKRKDPASVCTIVRPYRSRDGGTLDGHWLEMERDTIVWRMHGTVVAEWRPDGTRYIWGAGWAEHVSTREVWDRLLGVRTFCLPEKKFSARIGDRDRMAASGFSHGVPLSDNMQVDAGGQPVNPEHYQDMVRVVDPAKKKVADAKLRKFRTWLYVTAQLMAPADASHAGGRHWPAILDAPEDFVESVQRVCGGFHPDMRYEFSKFFPRETVYDYFGVYYMTPVPCSETGNYIPKR